MTRIRRNVARVSVFLAATLGCAWAQNADLLLVHLLPSQHEATWSVNGDVTATTTDEGSTAGYVVIPVGEIVVSARVDGQEVASDPIDVREGYRYVAYLHLGAAGAPAIVTGYGPVGRVRDSDVLIRAVNLVPDVDQVASFDTSACSGNRLVTRTYGGLSAFEPVHRGFRGPSTICAGHDVVTTLPEADAEPTDAWHAAPGKAHSIVLYIGADGPTATIVDETP